MAYKHDVFQEAWGKIVASYPALIGQHEAATNLIHKTIEKMGRSKLKGSALLSIINQSMRELKISQNQNAFRAFAGMYHGMIGQIVKHGNHWRAEQPPSLQERLPF